MPTYSGDNGTGNGGTTNNVAFHTHTYASAWSHDNDYHWHDTTCGHAGTKDKATHTWNSGIVTVYATKISEGIKTYTCTVCGATKTETIPVKSSGKTEPTEKSDFTYKEYQSGYALTSYCGTNSVVNVPSTYNGKSVLAIGIYKDTDCTVYNMPSSYELTQNAGFYANKTVTKVVLPNTITVIGAMAFAGCSSLKEVNIPTNCKNVYAYAFQNTALKSITIPQNTSISSITVFNNVELESIRFEGSIDCSGINVASFFSRSESQSFSVDDSDLRTYFNLNYDVDMRYGGTISYSFNRNNHWFWKDNTRYYWSETPSITTNTKTNRTYFEGRYVNITETTPTRINGYFYVMPKCLKKVYVSVKATNVNTMAGDLVPFSVEYYDGNTN